MSQEREVSREMQNAFVDGQLDAADWTALVERMGADEALRRRVCELRTLKDMVRGAYADARPHGAASAAADRRGWARVAGLALVFALAGGVIADRVAPQKVIVAANLLIEHVGAERANRTAHELGADSIGVLRGVEDIPAFNAGLNNTTTARDLGVLARWRAAPLPRRVLQAHADDTLLQSGPEPVWRAEGLPRCRR